jgi:hypothetical protein
MPPLRFVLYSRSGCELCESLHLELLGVPEAAGIPIEILDIETDKEALARYGHKIPVLFLGAEMVCHGRLDLEELHKTLALHRRPV